MRFKYNNLPLADAEDTFQEASCELWESLCDMTDWHDGVETDYGFISSETARMLQKERMYDEIDHLKPKDRSLIELFLQEVRMDKIAQRLGFRSTQVAKNRKSKIVVKLCKEINAQTENACASFFCRKITFVDSYSSSKSS